jgi:hypothetical protein
MPKRAVGKGQSGPADHIFIKTGAGCALREDIHYMKALYLSAVLQDSDQPVWRHFLVPIDITFVQLSQVMQTLFGYHHNKDWEFLETDHKMRITADPMLYAQARYLNSPEGNQWLESRAKEGHEVDTSVEIVWADLPVAPLAEHDTTLYYHYDFEDDWLYELHVLDQLDDIADTDLVVRDGLGTAPFEDCGGKDGYYAMLDALMDPKHPEHQAVRTWSQDQGYVFYDRDDVNAKLKSMRNSWHNS